MASFCCDCYELCREQLLTQSWPHINAHAHWVSATCRKPGCVILNILLIPLSGQEASTLWPLNNQTIQMIRTFSLDLLSLRIPCNSLANWSFLSQMSCHYGLRWLIFRQSIWTSWCVQPLLSLHLFDPRLAKQPQHLIDMYGGVWEHVSKCVCLYVCVCVCAQMCVWMCGWEGDTERERERERMHLKAF